MASGNEVIGNYFYRCNHAVLINSGFFNKVHNNTSADCIPNIEVDAPGFTYSASFYDSYNEFDLINVTRKIIDSDSTFLERYPEIEVILNLDELRQPQFNTFENNIFVTTCWKYRYKIGVGRGKQRDVLNDLFSNNIWITDKTNLTEKDFISNQWVSTSEIDNYIFEKFMFPKK